MTSAEIQEAFADFLGSERYNQFLRVLETTCREKNELMWWQEQAWEKFTSIRALAIPATLAAIDGIFANAKRIPRPLSRNEFLKDPRKWYLTEDVHIPPEWLSQAWLNTGFRRFLSDEIARSVSKLGGAGLSEELSVYTNLLTPAQVQQLYRHIARKSGRDPEEWSTEFELAFPNVPLP
jgi:hypothetical protein